MVSVSFLYPQYLFFLLIIPLFIFIHIVTLRSTRQSALKFANFEAIARIRGIDFFSKNIVILVFSSVIVFLLTMSVSGLTVHTIIDAASHSYVIALDTSLSMEADDIPPSRFIAAKDAAVSFIETTPIATKIGIISFSGNSVIEQDLTDSKILMKLAVNEVQLSPVGGTDVYDAVITGTNLLAGEESRALILLSDGQINVGSVDEAVKYANDNNVIVHTIAIGTVEGGETSFGLSRVDEESLQVLAYNTNGEFARAVDKNELISAFTDVIEKTKRKVGINVSLHMGITGLVLFVILYYLINSRYRTWP